MKKRILSGMRPTGRLHLGHLVGALNNWVRLQDEYGCLFMVADWHAFLSEYENPKELKEAAVDNVIDFISCGIDPEKSTLFIQSQVSEHSDLHIIFSSITPLGWLMRCPTYKEQLREIKNRDISTYGFLGYPVLQAADILIYKAEVVPVGEDQLPHLELTREIARRFRRLYKPVFPEPEALLTKVPRLLGLDGRKMSKSYNNTINLSDPADVVRKKTQSMFTDPKRIRLSDPGHPKTCNVHAYYRVFLPQEASQIDALCRKAEIGCTDCKKRLGLALTEYLAPIQEKRQQLLRDKSKIKDILKEGTKKAKAIAQKTLVEVRRAISLDYDFG